MSTFMSTICCFLPDDPRENKSRRSKWSSPDDDSGRGSSHKVKTGQPERRPLIPSSSLPPSNNQNHGVDKLQYQNLPSLDSISCSGYQTFTCRSSDGTSEATDDADDECSVDVNHLFKKGQLMAGPSNGKNKLETVSETGSPPPQPEITLTTSYDDFYHTLSVSIKNCRNLLFSDRPIINPFVQVYLLPDSSKRRTRRSKICFNSNDPNFDQHLLPFDLSPNQIDKHKLKICIYHSNAVATPPSPLKTSISNFPGQAKLDIEAKRTMMIQKWQSQFRSRAESVDEILLAQTTIPLSQYMLRKSLTRSYTLVPVPSPTAILQQLVTLSTQPAAPQPGLCNQVLPSPKTIKAVKSSSKSGKVKKLNNLGKLHLDLRFVLKETSQSKMSPNSSMRKKSGHTAATINPRALGTLEIKIVSAEGLPLRDIDDIADNENIEPRPYCKVFLYSNNDSLTPTSNKTNGKPGLRHGLKQRTPTCEKATSDPTWNYLISYHNLTLELLDDVCIEISIWDSRDRRKNTFIGGIRLSSVNMVNDNTTNSFATNLNELAQQHSFDSRRDNYFDCHEEERNLWMKFLTSCRNPSYNRYKNHNYTQSTLGLRTFKPFDSFRSSFGLCFYESC